MKVSIPILTALVVVLISCRKEEVLPPGPHEEHLLTHTQYFYYTNSSEPHDKLVTTVTVDSTERSIISRYDSPAGTYQKRFFDESWRLTMIVSKERIPSWLGIVYRMDTVNIIRQPGSINLKDRYNEVLGTISTLPDGRQEVYYAFRSEYSGPFRGIFNRNGQPDYEASNSTTLSQNRRDVKHYQYNPAGRLIAINDTAYTGTGGVIARLHTIEKDNFINNGIIKILKQMMGTDLEWLLSDRYLSHDPFNLQYDYYSGFLMFQNGTLGSTKTEAFTSTDSITFIRESFVLENKFTSVYDTQDRLTDLTMIINGKIQRRSTFAY